MEGKIPPEESRVWTLSDFIERRKDWDQGDETRLAEYLQQLSNKINEGAKNTLNELNDLVSSVDDTVIKVANINNEFQLLADKQFIENKVQEEDETVQTNIEKPVVPKSNDADVLVNNLKKALKNSFKAIDTHFERVTVIISDSDDDDEESKHAETVLRPRTFYKKLNLPPLSGDTLPEIDLDCIMSSETDSDVEQPMNTYKDEESLSNDVPEEQDISYSPSESKIVHDSTPTVTQNNIFEPEKFVPTNDPVYVDDVEDDLFSPPPLLSGNDEDDLDNEYNLFGNSNSNIYGDKNFWDDNDDEEDFLNQPPLPIHSDELPQPVLIPNPQEKVEAPSIQQSLNDELRKKFQKDNNSLSSNNINIESSKIKLPKGAVNILGGTDTKPYISAPTQSIKQATLSEVDKSMTDTKRDSSNDDDANCNISKKLLDNSNQSPLVTAHKELMKEISSIKKRSFFEPGSDDEYLFSKNIPSVTASTIEISKHKDNLPEKSKLSKTIFSESDSDEDFMSSKSNNKISSKPTVEDNRNKHLDSSSDDDLFNNKSILKERSVLVSSKIQDEYIDKNKNDNVKKQKSKLLDKEKNKKEALNKEVIDELKRKSEDSSVILNNSVIKKEFSPSSKIFNTNSVESSSIDTKTDQSIHKSLNSQKAVKTFNNLFSSDEDDLDDNAFFNVNESNRNRVKEDNSVSTNLVNNITSEVSVSKIDKMFDSSSDDDIFNVNKSNNFVSSKNNQPFNYNEIKNVKPKQINNQNLINQIQKSENSAKKSTTEKKTSSIFSLLSDDEDDDFSFNNINNNSKNLPSSQEIKENSSSEEFLNPLKNSKNKDTIQKSSPEDLIDNVTEINIPKNENVVISIESKSRNEKSLIFLSNSDEQLSSKSKVKNKMSSTSNVSFENSLVSEKQELLKNKEINIPKNESLNNLNENFIQSNKLPSFLSDDNNQEPSNSVIQNDSSDSKNEQIKKIHNISESSFKNINPNNSFKDSVDGLSFSSPNSINETSKKLPGKLNKNVGAFINVKGLLPNSKSLLKSPNTPQEDLTNENYNDNLPTSGTKLFSAEKERAKIQVKRRPPSRKARQATRTSYVDIGHESNLQESSRLFGSTSNLVDYQSSPILNDDGTDSLNEVKSKKIEVSPKNNLFFVTNDKNNKQLDTNNVTKMNTLDLFDDDSDPFDLSQEEEKCRNNSKDKKLDNKLPEIEVVHKQITEVKSIDKLQSVIESSINKLEIDSVQETLLDVKFVKENQVAGTKTAEKIKSSSVTKNTVLDRKSKSLFDDDDDDLFSPKSEKTNVSSSNIFDSDEELEFGQKFTKKNLAKTKSIFGDDDSDEDLFSTPSKPSSNLHSQNPIGKSSHQQNRSVTDRCVKLAAESVAVNPLESIKD